MRFNVAMIGLAHPHTEGYLETLDTLDEVERVFFYDSDSALATERARTYSKAGGVYTDLHDLFSSQVATHALITVPNDQSARTIVKAIDAGINVFAEKPAARSAKEFVDVLTALGKKRVAFSIGYGRRRHPVVLQMRDLFQRQAIGQLRSIELRMVTTAVSLRNPDHWLFDKQIAGGGILSWLACHLIDVTRFVTGDEFANVTAELATSSGESIDVEDTAAVAFSMSSGAVGTLHAGYLLTSGRAGYQGSKFDQGIHLRGTHGNMSYTFDKPLVLESVASAWRNASPRTFDFTLPPSPGYGGKYGLDFFREFLSASPENPAPSGPIDAIRVLELLDAIYEADHSGTRVKVTHHHTNGSLID